MPVSVDVQQLRALGGRLGTLGSDVAALRSAAWSLPAGSLQTLVAMADIQSSVIDSALVPSVSERLSETGEVMAACAEQYRDADESSAADIARTITAATGTWGD